MKAYLITTHIERDIMTGGLGKLPPVVVEGGGKKYNIIEQENGVSHIDYLGEPVAKRARPFRIGEIVPVGAIRFKIVAE